MLHVKSNGKMGTQFLKIDYGQPEWHRHFGSTKMKNTHWHFRNGFWEDFIIDNIIFFSIHFN